MSDEQTFDLNAVMPLSFVKNYLRIDNDLDDGFLTHAVGHQAGHFVSCGVNVSK